MKPNLPQNYIDDMKKLLQEEYPLYEASFDHPRYYGLRVNTAKISVDDFVKQFPYHLEPVPWCKSGFYYNGEDVLSKHPYYYAGLYYLQEPSAMLPAEVLEVDENCLILDGCAAPGGKSTALLAKMKGDGLLISNDISSSRAQGLLKNLELAGMKEGYVISEDLNKLAQRFENTFDRILIDAPCSGQGMFRKEPSLITAYLERGDDYYSALQKQIVTSALKMLKKGGKMVYSTCTFSVKEDEEIVRYMLDSDPQLRLLEIENCNGFADGLMGLRQCKRLYPHRIQGEGHFVAYLQKGDDVTPAKCETHRDSSIKLNEETENFLKQIQPDALKGKLQLRNDKLLLIPDCNFNSSALRVLRSGLLLGEIKNNHFEPSTTLALALKMNEFNNVLNLDQKDERVIRYLKGETISIKEKLQNGYVLICVDDYPLGFGKYNNGLFKNKYEKAWRWL